MTAFDYIRHLPLQRKLMVLLLVPCIAVLLVAGATMLALQIRQFRNDFLRDLQAVAQIVGANSTAAITFNDTKAAREVLASLEAKAYIVSAALVTPDGKFFASHGRHQEPPRFVTASEFIYRDNYALLYIPVHLEQQQVATLHIVSDYRTVYAGVTKLAGWMVLVVLLVGIGVAALLSNWLQRFISDPVLRLAHTAQTVADNQDYTVRAREESGTELGVLTRTFNEMLARIQEQDLALTTSQKKVETLVNSIEGIVWECNPETFAFTYVSQQATRLVGYAPDVWLAAPSFWATHLHPEDARKALAEREEFVKAGKPYTQEYRFLAADGRTIWMRETGSVLQERGRRTALRGIFQDITTQKEAAHELDRLNRDLLEASRMAGMAEVATGVLHNVGNVLNSVSVSATIVSDRLKQSKAPNLRRATEMLRDRQSTELASFLTADPKGQVLPAYLGKVAEQITTEQTEVLREVTLLNQNIEHIKEIVAMQQSYAKVSGAFEYLDPADLVEDALRMNSAALERHRIEVVRDYAHPLPRVYVDRHKVLQILINLVRNAKYALDAGLAHEKRLTVSIQPLGASVALRVRDNGIGIAPENVVKIFQHGFTTKKNGHGFGLHSGANAAKEMGGQLRVHSDGLGHGAEFTLELPLAPETTATFSATPNSLNA